LGFVGYFETSAKDGRNIETAARELVGEAIENRVESQGEGPGRGLGSRTDRKGEQGMLWINGRLDWEWFRKAGYGSLEEGLNDRAARRRNGG
jgi:hypothetical protein